jgi:hypothetical protein
MMWRILEQLRQHSRLTHRSLSVLQTIHVRIVQTRYELVPQLELDKKYMQLDGGDFLLRGEKPSLSQAVQDKLCAFVYYCRCNSAAHP